MILFVNIFQNRALNMVFILRVRTRPVPKTQHLLLCIYTKGLFFSRGHVIIPAKLHLFSNVTGLFLCIFADAAYTPHGDDDYCKNVLTYGNARDAAYTPCGGGDSLLRLLTTISRMQLLPLALSQFSPRAALRPCENWSAAPASPRCFCRRQRSARLPLTGTMTFPVIDSELSRMQDAAYTPHGDDDGFPAELLEML